MFCRKWTLISYLHKCQFLSKYIKTILEEVCVVFGEVEHARLHEAMNYMITRGKVT